MQQIWLKQARRWLEADLQAWTMVLNRNPKAADFITSKLQHWQTDPSLASIREKGATAELPPDEQAAWQQLWVDVRKLLDRLETKKQ